MTLETIVAIFREERYAIHPAVSWADAGVGADKGRSHEMLKLH